MDRVRSWRTVAFPFTELFAAVLLVYAIYSVWAGLDARLPIAAALVLLVVAAIADAAGATATANTLAVFVFLLLAAGVVLLLVEHVRESRAAPPGSAGTKRVGPQAPDEPERTAEEPLDRFQ